MRPASRLAKARLVVRCILDQIGQPNTEVFPKHDRLDTRAIYGNYIYAPLFGALVPHGRTVFLDPDNGFKPHPEQWQVLETVVRITEHQLDELIELNDLTPSPHIRKDHDPAHRPTNGQASYGLPPCAQRMLAEGVTELQRVSCFPPGRASEEGRSSPRPCSGRPMRLVRQESSLRREGHHHGRRNRRANGERVRQTVSGLRLRGPRDSTLLRPALQRSPRFRDGRAERGRRYIRFQKEKYDV